MFHEISEKIKDRMSHLEEIDTHDRIDGTERLQRLRQIPPETGKFLSLLAMFAPDGEFIEIGTSAGYSTLWIVLACKERGKIINTFEILPEKIYLAKKTFKQTQTEKFVNLIEGNALDHLSEYKNISFCFLDAEKEVYEECYDLIIPNLVKGGILIADNAINHRETLQPMLDKAIYDQRVDSLIISIGKGELVCRKK